MLLHPEKHLRLSENKSWHQMATLLIYIHYIHKYLLRSSKGDWYVTYGNLMGKKVWIGKDKYQINL